MGSQHDARQVETFEQGQKVITEGEAGDKFYIIEAPRLRDLWIQADGEPKKACSSSQDGLCVATKGDTEVMSYAAGDYFGELAPCWKRAEVGAPNTT